MTLLVVGLLVVLVVMPRGPSLRRSPEPGAVGRWVRTAPTARLWSLVGRHGAEDAVATLPELLELTARSRRAGMALLPSLVTASDLVPAAGLKTSLARVEAGSGLVDALDDWASSIGHADVDLVVAVLLLGDASGAAVASRLDSTAATLRGRTALGDEIRALTAQTRASATVVALAPVGFALVVAATDDRFVGIMLGTPIGRMSLLAGSALDLIGLWWMRRLTKVVA